MKILAIDYGEKKIGLAQSEGQYASGIGVVDTAESLVRLVRICTQNSIEKIVIGLPEGNLREQVLNYGEKLKSRLKLEIQYWDETLSSQKARQNLNFLSRKSRKQKEHQTAAAVILQSYLDETN